MKRKILVFILITIFCNIAFSQIQFENGYFIDESGTKTECLIKNIDWINNPNEFIYKLSLNDSIHKETIYTVKEFGIYNSSKYIRAKIKIDRSSEQIDEISYNGAPDFQEELLFLKVLIEGQASLFLYIDGNLTRFFYKINDSSINQLVYKLYKNQDNKILMNNRFRQQLWFELKCSAIKPNTIENLNYSKQALINIFIEYNECSNPDFINYERKQKRDLFNLNIRPGFNITSISLHCDFPSSIITNFENECGYRFGTEAEFILPFNRNKWALLIEPNFQYLKFETSEESNTTLGGIIIARVNYESFEIPAGVRHNFYLNDKSILFANISFVFNLPYDSSIEYFRRNGSTISKFEINPRRNIAIGAGYKFKNKYSLEIRYQNRELLNNYIYWNAKYNSLNLIFGLSFF